MSKYVLSGPQAGVVSGQAHSLVVIFHGYGASGDNVIELGREWKNQLPNAEFIAPNGPQVCEISPSGYQWFSMGDWTFETMRVEAEKSAPQVYHAILKALEERLLGPERLILVGFSQGAMMALMVGLEFMTKCAGIVAYSGAYLPGPTELKYNPPILIVHGENDEMVPVTAAHEAESCFHSKGIKVLKRVINGLGHGIDDEGLILGGQFIKQSLSLFT